MRLHIYQNKRVVTRATVMIAIAMIVAGCGSSKHPQSQAKAAQTRSTSSTKTTQSTTRQTKRVVVGPSRSVAEATHIRSVRVRAVNSMVGCLRTHGVRVPPQNPQEGFSTKGMDTNSAAYRAAYPVCFAQAEGVYRAGLAPR